MSATWRYAWLLIGVVGLMILVNLPDEKKTQGAARRGEPETLSLDGEQSRIDAIQKPWLDALWQPDQAALASLLAEGTDVDQVLDTLGSRPLHLLFIGNGCRRDQRPTASSTLAALELLLAAGADPNALDSHDNTPLMLAVAHCDARVINQLVAAGADLERVNRRGLTAFEMTLSDPGDAAHALLAAGFRLSAGQARSYREIYADEVEVLTLLDLAGPETETSP